MMSAGRRRGWAASAKAPAPEGPGDRRSKQPVAAEDRREPDRGLREGTGVASQRPERKRGLAGGGGGAPPQLINDESPPGPRPGSLRACRRSASATSRAAWRRSPRRRASAPVL